MLRGLEYFRCARGAAAAGIDVTGALPDEWLIEAVELVRSNRGSDGRRLIEKQYPGVMPVEIDEGEGRPSRWITLHALRMLD